MDDALCRRFDLWKKLDQIPGLDPRTRQSSGFAPSAVIAQFLFAFTSGGVNLADAERLGKDRVLLELLGLAKTADQTTLGEFLRAQSKESVLGLVELNAPWVDWAWRQAPQGRLLHGGSAEYFFDDTELEAPGRKIEGARINAWLRHLPGEGARAHTFAVVRRKKPGERFYQYGFVLCQAGEVKDPQAIFERHQLKGAKEQGFSQTLRDLDLHHPPCLELIANQAFYAIATLAYNILTALRVMELPEEAQGWRVRSII